MVRLATTLLLASLSASALAATSCSATKKCPADKPCCSQYGQCGTGAYCLGGCDIQSSFAIDSCTAMPICEDKTYTFGNLDNFALNTKYLGDASTADWTYSGYPKSQNGDLLMTMPKNSVGTLIANNHYIWYGKVSGKIKSSRGQGVVTAFILLSDVKDEIDYEFVGADLTAVQSNFYWQGAQNWTNSANETVNGQNTFSDWHTYEINWTPDQLEWIIDGQVKRTLTKASTYNATSQQYQYPQTPSRVQLSLWPAGQASNAKGTINWAGGVIDWNSQDIQQYGYYYSTISEVDVQCYSPPSGTMQTGNSAYVYTSTVALQNDVAITNNSTVLSSFGATGSDPSLGAASSSSAAASSSSTPAPNSVPSNQGGGGSMAGNGTTGTSSSGSGSGSGSGTSPSSPSGSSGFSQGMGGSGSGTNGAAGQNERVLRGSLFAVLVAVVGLVAL